MTRTISAFRWAPPFAQGYVRDHRVRWALEEIGAPYQVHLVDGDEVQTDAYRAWQPFGQVPAYRDGEVELFESGAIILHLARGAEPLAPADPVGFARVTTWVIAALNSVEPYAQNLASLDSLHADAPWVEGFRPVAEAALRRRLAGLEAWLAGREYLEGRFTAADIVMSTVLRELAETAVLAEHPRVAAYLHRCLARPAWSRALAAQLDTFARNAPREPATA